MTPMRTRKKEKLKIKNNVEEDHTASDKDEHFDAASGSHLPGRPGFWARPGKNGICRGYSERVRGGNRKRFA
jgi:hypothetical protein